MRDWFRKQCIDEIHSRIIQQLQAVAFAFWKQGRPKHESECCPGFQNASVALIDAYFLKTVLHCGALKSPRSRILGNLKPQIAGVGAF